MKTKHTAILLGILLPLCLVSCEKMREKVSITGVLIANTEVDDRIEMSYQFYKERMDATAFMFIEQDSYSFLVGADSHLTTDPGRLDEMFKIALDEDDLFVTHLGDIADTKAEYYARLDSIVTAAKQRYVDQRYDRIDFYEYVPKGSTSTHEITTFQDIRFPFYPVVGNHDITRNGWALWSNIFHSSFYEVDIVILGENQEVAAVDHLIFLDSASGTLGQKQIELIEQGVLDGKYADGSSIYRNTFVFSHTNIFRPQFNEMASTFTREETFFLLDRFEKWNVTAVFCGHVHTWDERDYNGVHYLTLDTMCESERPDPGDYVVRIIVDPEGQVFWEPVRMNYVPKKK